MKYLLIGLSAALCALESLPAFAQTTGTVTGTRAYAIESTEPFTAGQLADAFYGDFVLENNRLRAVVARPGKPQMGEVRGGSLIDVTARHSRADYIAALNSTADPASTGSVVIYQSAEAESPAGNGTTASVTLQGYVGELGKDMPDQAITVETRYSLAPDSDQLRIDTHFRNSTTAPAWIQPADLVDWGEAQVFTEGSGYSATTSPAHFAIGQIDAFSLGYYTSGSEAMAGYHAGRNSVILGSGEVRDLVERLEIRKLIEESDDQRLPPQYHGMGASIVPKPGMVVLPGTETRYGVSGGMPVQQPIYVPKQLVRNVDGETTITQLSDARDDVFTRPEDEAASGKFRLDPGATFSFTRYLVVAGENWTPILDRAYQEKQVRTNRIVGAVLETNTDAPVSNAVIQFSAADEVTSRAFTGPIFQVTTAKDGSFSASLPAGSYNLRWVATGRSAEGTAPVIKVSDAGGSSDVHVLRMSPVSTLRFAISEAETATSSPLPSKLTIIAKPPFEQVNFGFTPDVQKGVRNTIHMPQGYAVVPLTPGRYRLVGSRGIEYDIVERDITIRPGQQLTISASLPHVMKDRLQGMVSLDAGVLTTGSASGFASPESRAIQAACEGVSIIVSGDYGQATDLQSAINRLGLQQWVKAFMGRRELLHLDDMSADLFVYPLTPELDARFAEELAKVRELPPDIAMADLRKAFPELIFEISRPIHPEAGYLNSFPFDDKTRRFVDDVVPPPDFNAIQLVEGSKLGNSQEIYDRYMALQLARLGPDGMGKGAPLSPVGSSMAQLPHGSVIGSPRTYLYLKQMKSLQDVTASEVAAAIRGQHFLVSNGPVLLFDAADMEARAFTVTPGEIVDSSTTEVVHIRARVLAAPWVSLQGLNTRENGMRGITVFNILPTDGVLRYPTNRSGANYYTRYLKNDAILDAYAYSTMDSLAPVVPDALPDYGGEVFPFAWSGPIFVDRDGDGKVEPVPEEITLPTRAEP